MKCMLLLLPLLEVVVAIPGARSIRSTSCDPQYSALSSNHTMCLTDVGVDDPLSVIDKQNILDKHNQFRGSVNPTATNLVKLVWDDDIAVVAAKWARQCKFGHDKGDDRAVPSLPGVYIGQNLGFGYRSTLGALVGWHDEVHDFTYGQNTTKLIGHYTQIVGQRALRIGCGQSTCTVGRWPTIQACNYAMGQFNSDLKTPYKLGESCSDCPAGQCTNNLCDCGGKICLNGGTFDSKTCSCRCRGVFHGDTCEKDCGDKRCENGGRMNIPGCTCTCSGRFHGDRCEQVKCPLADPGWCTLLGGCPHSGYNQYCPILCGVCPGPAGCPNKRCQNGAELQQDCVCDCYQYYSGDTCQTLNCPAPGQEASFCQQFSDDACSRYYNVPLLCPRRCGICS